MLHHQLEDILSSLNGCSGGGQTTKWGHIGVGREDGLKMGEYSPILYPISMFKLLHFETKGLGPMPKRRSKWWDASSERILTIGVFESRHTGQRLVASNIHLDNDGSVAREKSAAIILDTLQELGQQWARGNRDLQYFVAGDFNSLPTQEAYQDMDASGQVADVYNLVPKALHFGDDNTFTGFQPDTDEDKDEIGRIDLVWLGPKDSISRHRTWNASDHESSKWIVKGYSVVPNVCDSGVFSSDHRAVVADVVLASEVTP